MATFGQVLRAYRLGYRISKKRRAFVKITDSRPGTLNLTLVPLGQHVPHKVGGKHYCWWEDENNGEDLLDMIPAIRNVRQINKTVSFDIFKETGERVTK